MREVLADRRKFCQRFEFVERQEFSPINLHLVTLGAAAEVFEGEDDVDIAIALSETVACRQHALYFRADAGFLEEFAHHCFLEGLVLLDVAPRNGPTALCRGLARAE